MGEIPKMSDVRIKESKGSRQVSGLGTGWDRVRLAKIGYVCMRTKWLQLCLTLCDPMDCSLPDSSVHGILQTRILEWAAISFSNACMNAKSLQSCPTLCDPMNSSPPGSSVHRIL